MKIIIKKKREREKKKEKIVLSSKRVVYVELYVCVCMCVCVFIENFLTRFRFDECVNYVELDYPRDISSNFGGVGNDIDAVFQWKDGKY